MGIIGIIKDLMQYGMKRVQEKEVIEPLSTFTITYAFCSKEDLLTDEYIAHFAEDLNMPPAIIHEDLSRILSDMRDDLSCCVEYPYVDEYYRDTYYTFYSHKHGKYNRFCFRISFFTSDVNEDNFYDVDMTGRYLGYMVLRPTPKRIIGYTFFSPLIYKEHNFSCCLCGKTISVMGQKLHVFAFPFCGQDTEVVSCSEIAIVMMLDYFSRRYNKYSRLLPSEIVKMLSANYTEREFPSRGLDYNSIALILQNYGLKTRIYSRPDEDGASEYSNLEFENLLNVYIDSGFPIYACTEDHAFLIIGKENGSSCCHTPLITINDNERPYKSVALNMDIKFFIVPLSDKIYLDAESIKPQKTFEYIKNEYPKFHCLEDGISYKNRMHLTTSRSFKDYIIHGNLCPTTRMLIVCTAMPKFIWVCEMFEERNTNHEDFYQTPLNNIIVYDATECTAGYNYLLLAKTRTQLLVPESTEHHKQYRVYETNEEILYPHRNNLKGEHTQWQS